MCPISRYFILIANIYIYFDSSDCEEGESLTVFHSEKLCLYCMETTIQTVLKWSLLNTAVTDETLAGLTVVSSQVE